MSVTHLASFISLGPRTSLYTPSQPRIGELIIMCTWLGASSKHLAKYATLYQNTAPRARILLIQSNVSIITSSYKHQREVIKSAVAVLLDTLSSSKEEQILPKILLHTFSNGGTNTATQLLIVAHKHLGSLIPLSGLIFDSCPAKGTYWKSYDAMLLSLPKNAVSKIIGPVICHGILILLNTWIYYGNENPASLQRRTMLDEKIVGAALDDASSGVRKPISYLYSKTDKMCDWEDIHSHANDARETGYHVEEVVFEGSGHCAHYNKHPVKYGEAIKNVWSELKSGAVSTIKSES